MTPEEWWKNFALGLELDVAGTFIYNGISRLDELEYLDQPVDIFEVIYNLSVGIERLLKVAIVLLEHNSHQDMEAFEKSLISHNTMELANRVEATETLGLAKVHKEFLSLLSKFYKTHRYSRFSLGSIPNIRAEKELFLKFLGKHLGIEVPTEEDLSCIHNTDQIRKFIGKIVKKISGSVFETIRCRANVLNIYTDELQGDSKAIKVFYGERLDFIDERVKKKELILFLINQSGRGDHIDLLRTFEPLELDPEMTASYIKALLNDTSFYCIEGEIDELYTEIEDIQSRINFVEVIDNEHLSYDNIPEL